MIDLVGMVLVEFGFSGFRIIGLFEPDDLSLELFSIPGDLDHSGSLAVLPCAYDGIGVSLLQITGTHNHRCGQQHGEHEKRTHHPVDHMYCCFD